MKTGNVFFSRNWVYFSDLVLQKARAGLRAEVSRGYMGVLWWVIEPVVYMAIFYIVFAHLLNRGDDDFVVFLLTGLIVWKWFHATINTGSNSLMANSGLMNQVYIQKIIFPLTNVAVNTFKFLIILVLFLIFLLFMPINVSLNWAYLPILILAQLLLTIGLTSFLAGIMPFFPDLKMILDNILTMLFFLSGIFFDISSLPAGLQTYLSLNPMAALITMYRQVLLQGVPPDWQQLSWVTAFSFMVLVVAILLLRRFDRVYPKIIH